MSEPTVIDEAGLQARIRDIAGVLLRAETPAAEDHFLALGGDSLLATVFARKVEVECGLRPSLEEIFTLSFAEMAEALVGRQDGAARP
ncbi:MAG: phosphopantetheine-binding protein [Martelella sp.]|uniref:phosphopantetheine-binding protein n=1 Tax=Martelella sp. TaxID=1969699 RepID=UPI00324293DE